MGTTVGRSEQVQEDRASVQDQATTTTSAPQSSNQDRMADCGIGRGQGGAYPSGEDWTTYSGGSPEASAGDWAFAVEDANGFVSRGVGSRVRLGDTVILTCDLGCKDASQVRLSVSAPGFDAAPLTMKGTTAEILLFAVDAGHRPLTVDAATGQGEDQRHFRFASDVSVEMDATGFCNKLTLAQALVVRQYMALEGATDRLAAAWSIAYENHVDTLHAAAKEEQLGEELLIGAMVAFVSAAAGAGVGAALSGALFGKVFVEGIKALVKFGVKATAPEPDLTSALFGQVPMDPVTFGVTMHDRLNQEMLMVQDLLIGWMEAATTGDPAFLLDFDPASVVSESLTVAGQSVQALATSLCSDPNGGAVELEKEMWAGWLTAFGSSLEFTATGPPCVTNHWTVEDNVNRPIRRRIRVLMPEGADAFIDANYDAGAEPRQEEADRRNGPEFRPW